MTDREILRSLATRVRDIAQRPEMAERRARWVKHNQLAGDGRPMVLCFPEGAWDEVLPPESCQCVDPLFRRWESQLRKCVHVADVLKTDQVIEPYFDMRWHVTVGDYGVFVPVTHGDNRGSYAWEPPLTDIERDLAKLHFRPLSVDRDATLRELQLAGEMFGDLLAPRIHGMHWWTLGLTWEAIKLIGLEQIMLAMYDQPDALHKLMAFLRDEHLHFIEWFEREGLLTDNTGAGDYVGSGGVAALHDGPVKDGPVKLSEMWGFAESQETVGISPAMFDEFVLPYQKPLLEKFALNYYGCCEQLEQRFEKVAAGVPRLRRVSVAPHAHQRKLAEQIAGKYVFCRKSDPVPVCVGFNEEAIRADLRQTLDAARGQTFELILKDTHTVEREPWRLARWVGIARDEIARAGLG